MTPERWQQITQLFEAALERKPSERRGYLVEVCHGDKELLREVQSLLSEHERAGTFMGEGLLRSKTAMLPPGTRLGPYEIVSPIGAGGMGVVYKARDTRLDRFIAIKMLPPEKVSDAERKRRFIQEAKAASALNHPSIITIYDIGLANGVDFIAMEYVPGKTLDQLIPRKGLRFEQALKYGVQIADALAAAHGAGIIHRDLKPANIMVAESGVVKVLDFGLAKLMEKGKREEWESTQTVEAGARTEEGMVLGTVSYMSPEQAEGQKIDGRSDVFSLGSVLYEMVTAHKAFQGSSRASTIAAILKEEPKAASEISQGLPKEFDRIIARCLRKDPDRRFHSMQDLRVELQELKEESDSGSIQLSSPAETKARPYKLLAFAAFVVLVLTSAGWFWLSGSRPNPSESPVRAVPLTSYPGVEEFASFSPDGSQVAFSWNGEKQDNKDIYVKVIGTEPPLRLTANSADDYSPAWSPDGRWIAFLRSQSGSKVALIMVSPIGGPERKLTETKPIDPLLEGPFLSWSPDSRSLIMTEGNGPDKPVSLAILSLETSDKKALTFPPADALGDICPALSPDGQNLVFSRVRSKTQELYLQPLSSDLKPVAQPRQLTSDGWASTPAWTPDVNEIVFSSELGLSSMSMSSSARPQRLRYAPDEAFAPAISREGHRLAYSVGKHDLNIWRLDVGGPGRKATTPPVQFLASTQFDGMPEYSTDGSRVAFISNRSGTYEIWVCDSTGLNSIRLTSFGGPMMFGPVWSPDSQRIAFHTNPEGNQDIYIISASGGVPRRLTNDLAADKWSWWSKDGDWLYFNSARTKESQIWKIPSSGGDAIQVTRDDGADLPHESPDGKWLFYSKGWPGPQSVWRMPVQGGEVSKVLDAVHPSARWTVGKDGIYFFTVPDAKGHTELSVYEFATCRVRKIRTIERKVSFAMTVSPDGHTILYTQTDEAGSDLMLIENFR